jgi:hypothetical protein
MPNRYSLYLVHASLRDETDRLRNALVRVGISLPSRKQIAILTHDFFAALRHHLPLRGEHIETVLLSPQSQPRRNNGAFKLCGWITSWS